MKSFNFRGSGGLGYLDVKTEKFIGLQRDINFSAQGAGATTSGDAPVVSIQTANEKSFWLYSGNELQQCDSASGQPTRMIPIHFDMMSVNTNFLAVTARGGMTRDDIGGVKIYNLASNHWEKVNVSKDNIENVVSALCVDGQHLWAGGIPKIYGEDSFITLVDMPLAKIIGRYAFKNVGYVFWIGINGDNVWFLAGLGGREVKLCSFQKSTGSNTNVPLKFVSTIAPKAAPDVPSTPDERRLEFLQKNFTRFVPVEFQKGANGQALVQRLRVKANMFEYDGEYYCGFKFTVPTWIDGDFEWMHVLAKTEAKKDFSATLFQWYIIPPSGQSKGFENFMRHDLASFPLLKQQFPYTHMIFTQYLDKSRLEPGKTYAIGFGFVQKDMPDIAFAMTITSKRGSDEFGALPLR